MTTTIVSLSVRFSLFFGRTRPPLYFVIMETIGVPSAFKRRGAVGASLNNALKDVEAYDTLYKASMSDPETFWAHYARETFYWKHFPEVPELSYNFDPRKGPVYTKFLQGAVTNVAYNCLDRIVKNGKGDTIAFLAEPNNIDGERVQYTYAQILKFVIQFAAALRSLGVKKGHLVTIYMPMLPELPVAMLACARIGAVHSVVFGGFSAESLANRIMDAKSSVVLTCDAVFRGSKLLHLKDTVDGAVRMCEEQAFQVKSVVVLQRVGSVKEQVCEMHAPRDIWWHDLVQSVTEQHLPDVIEWVEAEDPLFVLYTSGSTGSPKGILHTTAGYMVYTAATFLHSFAYEDGDVFFCTADCGWITGHSYVTYGPMLNAATQVIFEGTPTYPDAGRLWEITDRYKVAQLYTAPTAIRALKSAGDQFVTKHARKSLRVLGTVGEPINPEAWLWYFSVVGNSRCPVVDTWWQTETGGHAITPVPVEGLKLKPGAAMRPFFGIDLAVLNEKGEELHGEAQGYLVIKGAWPSTLRTIHGDHARMEQVYFSRFPGYYMTGDGCRRDGDGHYWLTGRVDDVLNVSGHRIGTAEVEAAIVSHPSVAEAAVVGVPHKVKGEAIYAFVTLMQGVAPDPDLKVGVRQGVREHIGGIAVPEVIHWAPGLPKTRSGKIMRRILRIVARQGAATSIDELGDTTTLADPTVVKSLLASYGQ